MAFKLPPVQPDFAQLKTSLANSHTQVKNNALYQTIFQLIERIERSRDLILKDIEDIEEKITIISPFGISGFPPGIDGEDGLDGLPGIQGLTGLTGATGIQGFTGLMGPPGIDGEDAAEPIILVADVIGILGNPVRVTNGGTGTATQFTLGSIVFAGVSGIYNQDNSNFFWDNTNKRLGLGTSTPLSVLHMLSPETSSTLITDTYSGGASSPSNNFLARSSRGTSGTPSAVQSGDTLFFFQARGSLSTGFTSTQAAGIQMQATENWTMTNQGAQLSLNITPNGSVTAIRGLLINSSSGITIGDTTDPGATNLRVLGTITTGQGAFLIVSTTAFNNGAAAGAGTLANAPAAGNPTKWIPINDNGTTRYIPTW